MFNYPSYLLLSDEKANIKIYAEKLLSDLKTVGAGNDNRRPLFIAHSYGGFLGKKALVLAMKDPQYSDIVRNTLVFYFLGTPESFSTRDVRPFGLGDLVDLYLEGVGASTLNGRAKHGLLKTLKTNTGSLPQITHEFNILERRWFDQRQTNGLLPSMYLVRICEWDATKSVRGKVSGTTKFIVELQADSMSNLDSSSKYDDQREPFLICEARQSF